MRKILAAAFAVAALGTVVTAVPVAQPAQAQSFVIGPDGVRVYPGQRNYDRYHDEYERGRRGVGEREAIRIARRNGVDEVRRVTRRRGDWVVTGEAYRGPGLRRVVIDGRTGNVIRVERIFR